MLNLRTIEVFTTESPKLTRYQISLQILHNGGETDGLEARTDEKE